MSIEHLMEKIIPPSDYQHLGFNNQPIIDKLTEEEKKLVEDALIEKLSHQKDRYIDPLIVDSLSYMRSEKALPVLRYQLQNCTNELIRLIIAVSMFEIAGDNHLVDIAITSLRNLDNEKDAYYSYKLRSAFYYLIKFKNLLVNKIIEGYKNHKNDTIAYNARRALNIGSS